MADDLLITVNANVKGVITAIDATSRLENRVKKLQKAVDEGRISNNQFDMALQKLSKSAKGYEKSVLDYSKSLQVANKAQKEAAAAEALAKKEAQAFAQARKEATAINKEFDTQQKLAAVATRQAAEEEERLKRKFIEGHAAMELYTKELNDLAVARKANIISSEQQQTALTRLNQQMAAGTGVFSGYGAVAQGVAKTNNQLGVATQQLGYQVGDFLVQIQSGTNPMVAFGQQATQLVGVLPMVAGQFGLTTAAAIKLSAVLGIAIPLVTAVGAVLLTTFMNSEKAVNGAEEALKKLKEETKQTKDEMLQLARGVASLAQSEVISQVSLLEAEINSLAKSIAELNDPDASLIIGEQAAALEKKLAVLNEELRVSRELEKSKEKAKEIEAADLAIREKIAEIRGREAEAYAESVAAAKELKDSLGEAYLEAINLGKAPIEAGIDRAAEAARVLAERLGVSLEGAQRLIRLGNQEQAELNRMRANLLPDERGSQRGTVRGANTRMPDQPWLNPARAASGGGSSNVIDINEIIAARQKQIEQDRILLGLSGQALEAERIYFELLTQNTNATIKLSDTELRAAASIEAANLNRNTMLEEQIALQKQIADTISSSMEDAFMSIVDGTTSAKDAFRSMAASIIKELYRVLVVQQMVGAFQSGGGGILGALAPIFGRASGGTVMSNTPYLVGEKGPEIIIPQNRGHVMNADLTAKAMGNGGGSIVVNNNINVSGGSDPAAIRAEVAKLMPQITSATKSAVIDARRRGGQMKAAFQ
jgi:hypothetical protein